MSDPRFARLRTDPRFRPLKRSRTKVVIDERFKSIFEGDFSRDGDKKKARVDKYGRKVSKTRDRDDLRRFYRLGNDGVNAPDYARGEGLVESSDEEAVDPGQSDSETSDDDKPITLGRHLANGVNDEEEFPEIDLDETNFEDLDRQAEEYSRKHAQEDTPGASSSAANATSRLAVVNLDWDHVKAAHLFKIFDSVVSGGANGRTRVLSVQVYPSQFGKERMAKEEIEGPPAEVFAQNGRIADEDLDEEDINEETIFQTGDDSHVNNEALRKYQLERLRYYYAIVTFDSAQTASVAYTELDGTELERSANIFDLSYVSEDMQFDDAPRDGATHDGGVAGLDFTTDALRHSKVKLTWDDDDTARVKVTRKKLTKKEMEDNDFRAYIASSGSSSEDSEPEQDKAAAAVDDRPSTTDQSNKKSAKQSREERRANLRGLLRNKDELPEGWGNIDGGLEDKEGELEVTFTPGLSTRNADDDQDGDNETTLERYKRRQREKKAARKAAREAKTVAKTDHKSTSDAGANKGAPVAKDDFFGEDTDGEEPTSIEDSQQRKKGSKKERKRSPSPMPEPSTKEELALLLAPENAKNGPKHFDMKEVIRAEKNEKKKGKDRFKKKKGKGIASVEDEGNREDGSGFSIDVADSRFAALHEEPEYAIDPSHPQFKATKSMTALVQERSQRQKDRSKSSRLGAQGFLFNQSGVSQPTSGGDLSSLVESVKRKSKQDGGKPDAKRRKF